MKSSFLATILLTNVFIDNSHGFIVNYDKVGRHSHSILQLSSAVETEVDNPRLSGLALALDEGTRKSHSIAENTAFVTGFFKGLSTKESYGALLTSLYYVYTAMENSFDATITI